MTDRATTQANQPGQKASTKASSSVRGATHGQLWEEDQAQLRHYLRIATTRSTIDNQPPQSYQHVLENRKRQEVEKARLREIQQENTRMVEKMEKIYSTPNEYVRPRQEPRQITSSATLNRKKKNAQIEQENQHIIRRLITGRANYNRYQWEHDFQMNEKYRSNISQKPEENHISIKHEREWVDTVNNPSILGNTYKRSSSAPSKQEEKGTEKAKHPNLSRDLFKKRATSADNRPENKRGVMKTLGTQSLLGRDELQLHRAAFTSSRDIHGGKIPSTLVSQVLESCKGNYPADRFSLLLENFVAPDTPLEVSFVDYTSYLMEAKEKVFESTGEVVKPILDKLGKSSPGKPPKPQPSQNSKSQYQILHRKENKQEANEPKTQTHATISVDDSMSHRGMYHTRQDIASTETENELLSGVGFVDQGRAPVFECDVTLQKHLQNISIASEHDSEEGDTASPDSKSSNDDVIWTSKNHKELLDQTKIQDTPPKGDFHALDPENIYFDSKRPSSFYHPLKENPKNTVSDEEFGNSADFTETESATKSDAKSEDLRGVIGDAGGEDENEFDSTDSPCSHSDASQGSNDAGSNTMLPERDEKKPLESSSTNSDLDSDSEASFHEQYMDTFMASDCRPTTSHNISKYSPRCERILEKNTTDDLEYVKSGETENGATLQDSERELKLDVFVNETLNSCTEGYPQNDEFCDPRKTTEDLPNYQESFENASEDDIGECPEAPLWSTLADGADAEFIDSVLSNGTLSPQTIGDLFEIFQSIAEPGSVSAKRDSVAEYLETVDKLESDNEMRKLLNLRAHKEKATLSFKDFLEAFVS